MQKGLGQRRQRWRTRTLQCDFMCLITFLVPTDAPLVPVTETLESPNSHSVFYLLVYDPGGAIAVVRHGRYHSCTFHHTHRWLRSAEQVFCVAPFGWIGQPTELVSRVIADARLCRACGRGGVVTYAFYTGHSAVLTTSCWTR